jgi:hypothetical protein
MGAGSGPALDGQTHHTDVGIVMLGESLQLHYANDRARHYMDRAGSMDSVVPHTHDLRLKIIKLGTQIRERNTRGSWFHPDEDEARKTVRTTQGAFNLRGMRVPGRSERAEQQIMILIEDRVNGACSTNFQEVSR